MEDLQGAVLFGAGRFTRALLPAMRRRGLQAAWVVDNNAALWGSSLEGVEIRPASSLAQAGDRLVLIMTTYLQQMAQACVDAGVRRWSWFTDIHEVFGDLSIAVSPETVLSEPEIDRLAGLMAGSAESLATLKGALACRVTGDARDVPAPMPHQYLADDIVPAELLLRFVDCGAYDGDTLREWIEGPANMRDFSLLRYHAFEPDPENFSKLRDYVATLPDGLQRRISLHPCAVGETAGSIGLIQGGPGTGVYSGLNTGPVTALERLDRVLEGVKVGSIKMDVEGYEPQALEGARGIIESQRPALMISVYHRPEHLWGIPLWIHDLGLGYRLRLRHHSATSSETVCYAVPPTVGAR
jgi:FkbM family methyltransferase